MEINEALFGEDRATDTSVNKKIILQKYACEEFAFATTMRLEEAAVEERAAFGIIIQYRPKARLHIHFLRQQGRWVLAVESCGITPVINFAQILPDHFNPQQWQILNIEQQAEMINISHNGQLILEILESTHSAQPGVMTQYTGAIFTGTVYIEMEKENKAIFSYN